jgi:hypothetical protein
MRVRAISIDGVVCGDSIGGFALFIEEEYQTPVRKTIWTTHEKTAQLGGFNDLTRGLARWSLLFCCNLLASLCDASSLASYVCGDALCGLLGSGRAGLCA